MPGGSVRLEFPDETQLDRAASLLGGARDDEALALNLASDGAVQSVRTVLDRLDAAAVAVDALSVKSADLDDVFLSLTGRRERRGGSRAMTAYLVTDSATMLRRSLRRMRRYPSLTFFIAMIPVVLLLLFTFVLGGTMGAGPRRRGDCRAAATRTSPTSGRGSC